MDQHDSIIKEKDDIVTKLNEMETIHKEQIDLLLVEKSKLENQVTSDQEQLQVQLHEQDVAWTNDKEELQNRIEILEKTCLTASIK